MALSEEEKKKIYEEEKARAEAAEQAKAEVGKKKKSKVKMGCLTIIAIFIVFGVIGKLMKDEPSVSQGPAGSTSSAPAAAPEKAAPPEPAIEISAMSLWREYEKNEVAADNKYKGKTLLVTGKVHSIDKDFMDNVIVRLKSPNQFMSTGATLEDSEKGKAASLNKGQKVTVQCRCDGKLMGTPNLRECLLK